MTMIAELAPGVVTKAGDKPRQRGGRGGLDAVLASSHMTLSNNCPFENEAVDVERDYYGYVARSLIFGNPHAVGARVAWAMPIRFFGFTIS